LEPKVNPEKRGQVLFLTDRETLVISDDYGKTITQIVELPEPISNAVFFRSEVFATTQTSLLKLTNDTFSVVYGELLTTSVSESNPETPKTSRLESVYPNPFNPTTQVRFSLKKASLVEIELYSVLGQKVHTLHQKEYNSGTFSVSIDTQQLSSGIYLLVLKTNSGFDSQKITILK
jgi:hypothetical protein